MKIRPPSCWKTRKYICKKERKRVVYSLFKEPNCFDVYIQRCLFLGLNIFVFIHHKAMTALGPFWNSGQKFLLIVMHEGCSRLFLLFLKCKVKIFLHCKWKSYFHWVKIFSPDIYMYVLFIYIVLYLCKNLIEGNWQVKLLIKG